MSQQKRQFRSSSSLISCLGSALMGRGYKGSFRFMKTSVQPATTACLHAWTSVCTDVSSMFFIHSSQTSMNVEDQTGGVCLLKRRGRWHKRADGEEVGGTWLHHCCMGASAAKIILCSKGSAFVFICSHEAGEGMDHLDFTSWLSTWGGGTCPDTCVKALCW